MKLATATDVTTRMGSNAAMGNIATAAGSVLEAATPILENILGTPLESADRIDWFSYNQSLFADATQVQFNLEQAFVEGAVSLYYSDDGKPVLPDFSNAEAIDAADLDLDEEKGIVTVFSIPFAGTSTVAAKYSAGFTEESAEIPSWLKEAAVSATVRIIHSQVIGHNKKDVRDMSPELHRILSIGVSDKIRPRLHGIFPNRTRVL